MARDSEIPPSQRGSGREEAHRGAGAAARLQGVIPELIKKAVIGGVDRASEARDRLSGLLGETKLPKEFADAIFSQIDETKNDLFRMVAKEIRGFLEAVDFQRELQKLLTTVSFEIKTEIRFIPNDAAPDQLGRPEVKAGMKVKRQEEPPPEREREREKKRRRGPLSRAPRPSAEAKEPRKAVPPPPVSEPPDDPLFGPDETPLPGDVD